MTKTFDTKYVTELKDAYRLTCWRHHEEHSLGGFGYRLNGKYIQYELVRLDDFDQEFVMKNDPTLKNGEIFARIDSDRCRVSGIQPLVKLNLNRGLVYFLDYSESDFDEDIPKFESRGIKCDYLTIINLN